MSRFASHALLVLLSLTMLAPFLWMLSTALKPAGQTSQTNWLPYAEYVTVDGRLREVLKNVQAPNGAGAYRLRIVSPGPERGRELEVSTDRLTPEMGSRTRFAYQPSPGAPPLAVERIHTIKPVICALTIRLDGESKTLQVPEDQVIRRVTPRWSNFLRAWDISGVFGRAYINSLLIAALITFGQVLTSSLAAYAFACLRFPGRDKLFLAYLATMMIPGAVTMVPLFVILKALPEIMNFLFSADWFGSQLFVRWWLVSPVRDFYAGRVIGLDSYFALIAPGLFSAYGTFMLRQFFMTVPRDLADAARIDGCGTFGVYRYVVMPLSKPALATLGILTFMGAWRGFLWPMVVTSSPEMQTLPVMLQSFMGATGTQWELLMAGTLIVMAPMILVFLLGQRYFIAGIRLGALKG